MNGSLNVGRSNSHCDLGWCHVDWNGAFSVLLDVRSVVRWCWLEWNRHARVERSNTASSLTTLITNCRRLKENVSNQSLSSNKVVLHWSWISSSELLSAPPRFNCPFWMSLFDADLASKDFEDVNWIASMSPTTPLSRFSTLLFMPLSTHRVAFDCRSSSISMRIVSISSISATDSRKSSANLQRSCSLRALKVARTFPSTFCDKRMQNG